MARRRRREYLLLLDSARAAAESAIHAYNNPWHPYRHQAALIFVSNSWELLAKAVLVHKKESIKRGNTADTISGEVAVQKLVTKKLFLQERAEIVQQIISLRNEATHYVLPPIPDEILQHLLFFSCKFFRELVSDQFPAQLKSTPESFLALSFGELTTYADKVQRIVSSIKRSADGRRLIWLLERGIEFDGGSYISQAQFERKYRGKGRVLPHLKLGGFLKKADMVRLVAVQAPRNFTADIALRKGSAADSSLPVQIRRTDLESDYPYLTKEIGQQLGKNQNWVARASTVLGLKGNEKYHQAVRASTASTIQRYSQSALELLSAKLRDNPSFNPYETT